MRRVVVLAGAVLAVLAAPAWAEFPGSGVLLLSRTPDGSAPNGESRRPAISQDKRFARLAAFESDATNVAPGAGGGTNVYVVERAGGYGDNGTPWEAGRTLLASGGMNGQPANGPSRRPSLDGTSRVAPHCVAFVSDASNLVRGDTNGKPDAFVRNLSTGRTIRVSVDSRRHQSSGSVSEVAVNGLCTRVAFVSDAGDLVLTRTRNPSWRSAVTRAAPAGRRQVYVRAIGGKTGLDRALKGLTFLASASARVPGDGDSYGIAFSTNSRALTFASDAGNLASGDDNGTTDVFQRVMVRAYGRRVHGRSPQFLRMTTQLVSRDAGNRAGTGASTSPASNVDGSVVSYVTTAPNLIGADPHGSAQVAQADLNGGQPRTRLVSANGHGGPGNGPSGAPSLTVGGTFVFFQSAASDIGVDSSRRPDTNGVQDVELFVEASAERWLVAQRGATAPASNPMTSPHGNYVVFERAGQVWLNYVGAK